MYLKSYHGINKKKKPVSFVGYTGGEGGGPRLWNLVLGDGEFRGEGWFAISWHAKTYYERKVWVGGCLAPCQSRGFARLNALQLPQ